MSYFGSAEFYLEVHKGNVPNHLIINKFGANSAVGTSFVPVCQGGVYQTPSTLQDLEIVSTDNTNDIAAGTGARKVTVYGIGTGWTEIEEEVTLTGTTPAALSNQFFRVYRMRVTESGVYATSAAPSHNSTITVQNSGAGVVWGKIISEGGFGLSSSEIGVYSLPTGMTAHLMDVHVDVEGAKVVDTILFVREGAATVSAPFSPMRAINVKRDIDGEHAVNSHLPLATLVGPADIGFMAKISSGTAKVEVEFNLMCVTT